MKNMNIRNMLFPMVAIILLLTSNSYAQGISTSPVPTNLIPNGIAVRVFSEFIVSINEQDSSAYQSFAKKS